MTVPVERGVIEPAAARQKTSIRVDPYLWFLFKERCEKLKLSTCFVVENLIRAWISGEQREIPKARPVTINMRVDYAVQRPRRAPPVEGQVYATRWDLRNMLAACWRLDPRDLSPGRVGWCSWRGKWLRPGECEGCTHQGEF